MFTGIVREIGKVLQISTQNDIKIRIGCARPIATIDMGASIACNGVCLTVVALGGGESDNWFEVDASQETSRLTTLGGWAVGTPVNLEPSLRLGDELGGHIVSGHIDGLGDIVGIDPVGGSHKVSISAPKNLGQFIAKKGSVTIDGISLTVNEVRDEAEQSVFSVNIIPHTWDVTNLAQAKVGTRVNLEIDLLARYVARLAEANRDN